MANPTHAHALSSDDARALASFILETCSTPEEMREVLEKVKESIRNCENPITLESSSGKLLQLFDANDLLACQSDVLDAIVFHAEMILTQMLGDENMARTLGDPSVIEDYRTGILDQAVELLEVMRIPSTETPRP